MFEHLRLLSVACASMSSRACPLLIAPSILSANFGSFAEEVRTVDRVGADWIHVDVMDGRFVSNLIIGLVVVKVLCSVTKKLLDVHLMIVESERYVVDFAEAGADVITVHVEACIHFHRVIQQIKGLGKKVGVSLNLYTSETVLDYVLGDLDLILVMSVNPGFGGQSFILAVIEKIQCLSQKLDERGLINVDIEVDGGINANTVLDVVVAGVRVLVAGSAVFGKSDYWVAIEAIR